MDKSVLILRISTIKEVVPVTITIQYKHVDKLTYKNNTLDMGKPTKQSVLPVCGVVHDSILAPVDHIDWQS